MGFYIETPCNKGKADYLKMAHGAEVVSSATARDIALNAHGEKAALCVVDNGPFEAAAILVDEHEYRGFDRPSDPRPKTWLAINKSKVIELTNFPPGIFHGE